MRSQNQANQIYRTRKARKPNRLSEAVIGVVVLALVGIGSFLLPSQLVDTSAEAGVAIEVQQEGAGFEPR